MQPDWMYNRKKKKKSWNFKRRFKIYNLKLKIKA